MDQGVQEVLDKNIDAVTTFPVAMARAATWNTNLEYEVHDVISKEMRANKTNYAATPCINLLRHPGWEERKRPMVRTHGFLESLE